MPPKDGREGKIVDSKERVDSIRRSYESFLRMTKHVFPSSNGYFYCQPPGVAYHAAGDYNGRYCCLPAGRNETMFTKLYLTNTRVTLCLQTFVISQYWLDGFISR